MSLRSSRKLGQRHGCVRGGASARGSPMRREAAAGVRRRGARVARAPSRHGGRVWEVRASAFEVELLPCLNYVRPSVRSGPGAEARPSGGAGGARGRCSAQVRAAGGAWGPELGALRSFEECGSPRPTPDLRPHARKFSGLREVAAAAEPGVHAVPPLCVYTWGERGSAGQVCLAGRAWKHGCRVFR